MSVSKRLVVSAEAGVGDLTVFSGQDGAIAPKLRSYTTTNNQSMHLQALDHHSPGFGNAPARGGASTLAR